MSISTASNGYLAGGITLASHGGNTIVWRQRWDVSNSTLLSVGTYAATNFIFYMDSFNQLVIESDVANSGSTLDFIPNLIVGEWYTCAVTIDTSGNIKGYVGKDRWSPADTLITTIYSGNESGSATMAAAAPMNICPLGFLTFFDGGSGAIRDMMVWTSVLTDSEISASMQPGITPSSSWGSGGLPANPQAFYTFSNVTDLVDHSGNSAPAFTVVGTPITSTDPTPPPKPGTTALNIVATGDSLTQGALQNLGGYPIVLGTLRPSDTVTNVGVFGASIAQCLTNTQSDLFPLYDPSLANVAIVMIGTNNCTAGDPATVMFPQLENLVNICQAVGFYTIVLTILPYGGSLGGQAERTAYNADILSPGTGADYTEDSGDDPYFVPSDLTIYNADEEHLLQSTGYTHLATIGANVAVSNWLAQFGGSKSNTFFFGCLAR